MKHLTDEEIGMELEKRGIAGREILNKFTRNELKDLINAIPDLPVVGLSDHINAKLEGRR